MAALSRAIARLIALYRREPAATQTAAAIIYAGGDMIYRVTVQHVGVLSWSVVAAAAVALYGLMVRAQVFPAAKIPPPVKAALLAGSPVLVPPLAPTTAPGVTTSSVTPLVQPVPPPAE